MKFSLFPEHLITLPLGVHEFTHSLYTLQNLSVWDYVCRLRTGLFAWIRLDCMVMDLFFYDNKNMDFLVVKNIKQMLRSDYCSNSYDILFSGK